LNFRNAFDVISSYFIQTKVSTPIGHHGGDWAVDAHAQQGHVFFAFVQTLLQPEQDQVYPTVFSDGNARVISTDTAISLQLELEMCLIFVKQMHMVNI